MSLDLAVLDDFLPLKHERALASAQFSAEWLHADEAGGMIVAEPCKARTGNSPSISPVNVLFKQISISE